MFGEFFSALKEGKLLGVRCEDCGEVYCPPKSVCGCGSRNLRRVELSGKGRVVSYTVTYVAPLGYDSEVPYVVAMVELDEGAWIMGRLDVDPETAEREDLIGRRVEVRAEVLPSEQFYPDKSRRIVPIFRIVQ